MTEHTAEVKLWTSTKLPVQEHGTHTLPKTKVIKEVQLIMCLNNDIP